MLKPRRDTPRYPRGPSPSVLGSGATLPETQNGCPGMMLSKLAGMIVVPGTTSMLAPVKAYPLHSPLRKKPPAGAPGRTSAVVPPLLPPAAVALPPSPALKLAPAWPSLVDPAVPTGPPVAPPAPGTPVEPATPLAPATPPGVKGLTLLLSPPPPSEEQPKALRSATRLEMDRAG